MTDHDLPTPNLPLLRKIIDHIEAHPEQHNQGMWGFKIASHIEWLTDRAKFDLPSTRYMAYKQIEDLQRELEVNECGTTHCVAGFAVAWTEGVVWDRSGRAIPQSGRDWTDAGRDALGLTDWEATWLFHDTNTLRQIKEVARKIAARGGEEL